jgi:beta-lactamase regulating signal transducer with metallopeptidase domain
MNTLLICGLQVTLVAFVGSLTSLLMRRWLRASATLPIATTLIAIVLLTACAFSSWPSWLHRAGSVSASTTARPESAQPVADDARTADMTLETFGWREAALAAWNGLMDQKAAPWPTVSNAADSPQPAGWTALQITGLVFALGFGVGLVRLLGGLWSVQHFVQTSRPLKTPSLIEELDVLRAELGCCSPVEIRECRHLATAATVGWQKPVILLSDSWRSWSEPQLRSVLAHEIAHITRNDYLAGVAAQLGVVLHFYHPLVHWLVSRFRLEQELAADELAAGVVGGSRAYLNAIGELALKQSNETLGWPAQAFLPTRSTFLRRIEMLRDLKLLSGKAPLAIRAGTLGAIAAVTLVAVGLRPPGGEGAKSVSTVAAEKPVGGLSGGQVVAIPLKAKYVPFDAEFVLVVRPAEIIKAMAKVLDAFPELKGNSTILNGCEQACLFAKHEDGRGSGEGFCLTFVDQAARDQCLSGISFNKPDSTKAKYLTFEYEMGPNVGSGTMCCYKPDDRTAVIAMEGMLQKALLSGPKSLSPLTETETWKAAENGAAVLAIDPAIMKKLVSASPQNPILGMFSPLWDSASNHTLGLNFDKQTNLNLVTQANDEASAQKIKATLKAGAAMLTNIVSSMKAGSNPEGTKQAVEAFLPILEQVQVSVNDKQVSLKLSGDTDKLAALLANPINAAKNSAQQSQHKNNLKMIMLAMHNYHDVHNHFPAAAVIDPESGIAHSWRVAILPYLDQGKLYQQYKMNEPWDSEANLKVLAQMPGVFKDPTETEETTNTAVTAAYGKNLAFEEGDKEGRKISDFTDGLSNTISIIAAQTEIPWTKPEDITIDLTQEKLPPQIGTDGKAFYIGFSDGSVRRAPENVDVKTFKIALTRNGGELFQDF